MKVLFLSFAFFISSTFENTSLRFLRIDDEIEKQSDTRIALPWGLRSSKTHMKVGKVILINLFGTEATGNNWRLLNEDELKEKWEFEPMNLTEEKSAPYVMLDNISGSRKMHHKGVWRFLFKAHKIPENGEPVVVKLSYGTSFEAQPEQTIDVLVHIHESSE